MLKIFFKHNYLIFILIFKRFSLNNRHVSVRLSEIKPKELEITKPVDENVVKNDTPYPAGEFRQLGSDSLTDTTLESRRERTTSE